MDPKALIEKTLKHFDIPASDKAIILLVQFILELSRWNKRINLVGLQDSNRIITELLADSFFLFPFISGCGRVVDLGSGSGIGAIPFAILGESLEVHSVDSNLKKIQFQRHARRLMGILNLHPVWGRIEMIEPIDADCLVARAFGATGQILDAAHRHLKTGGTACIVKGSTEDQTRYAGYDLEKSVDYALPEIDKGYRLLVYKKIS